MITTIRNVQITEYTIISRPMASRNGVLGCRICGREFSLRVNTAVVVVRMRGWSSLETTCRLMLIRTNHANVSKGHWNEEDSK